MKKFLFVFCMLILLVQGCSNENNTKNIETNTEQSESIHVSEIEAIEEVPESLDMAIKQIEKGDLDFASKYLDLTIQDFEDSSYVYDTHILKTILHSSHLQGLKFIIMDLSDGVSKGSSLLDSNDTENLKSMLPQFEHEIETNTESYIENIKYILETYKNYPNRKPLKINPVDYRNQIDNSLSSLTFFADVGYPVPTESEITNVLDMLPVIFFKENLENILNNDEINILEIFYVFLYTVEDSIENNDLKISICEEILQLEKDNPYGEIRLQVEEYLENLQKE